MKTRLPAVTTIFSTIRMVAAFVVLAAQFGVVGAGVLDGREGASAASHFENGGTNLHFAHNEADCFMCRAQHLGDAAPFNIEPPRAGLPEATELVAPTVHVVAAVEFFSNTSRAPPTTV